MKSLFAIVGMIVFSPVLIFALLIIMRLFVEARYIPSSAMEPTIQINDRLVVEKSRTIFNKRYSRGDILVFYPPPIELGGKDLSNDPLTVLGRLTGLPFLPYEPAYIKRVIGLPGDRIQIERGIGVYVNGKLLDESQYTKGPADYELKMLGNIGGHSSTGALLPPYANAEDPIIVPPNQLFLLGDNRNNSEDSHVWGFLDQKRVIGRAYGIFWRRTEAPLYPRFLDD
jgi:signal peptidase I